MSSDWSQQLADELHKPITRNFQKRTVISNGIDEIWAADLVEMQKFSKFNKGIKYLLMVIDVFSKYGWIRGLKNKKTETVSKAFDDILSGRKPKMLWTDKGSEFISKHFKDFLKSKGIKLYHTENEEKSSVVERWNKTMKNRMWKMFTVNNNTVYFDKIDKLVNDIKNSTAELPLPTDDIMDLLNLCLTSTYFQYNGKHYKQLHGTAMGSPVSVVVAEIVMQNIEEQALATYTRTIPIWLRYVDDTFTAVHKDGIDDFHEHLNRQNADIQFTKEIEENGKIPFLDCLVTRNNNKLQTTVYRKPTHTDRLLDQSSYNPTSHKATTIRTLTRRAQLVCDSPNSLQDETDYLYNVFSKNNYNTDFVRRNTHSNTDTQTNVNSGPVTTATVPYIRGTSETIARILQPYNIRVAHKPITTLRRLLTNVKDKDKPEDRQGAVYKIKCCDCQASYIGETGRNLSTRLTEHKRATRNGDVNNHIAEHHLQTKHQIDWDSATCITYSTDYHQRLTLESWFTNLEQTPLNRSQQLPAPYKRLIDGMKRN